MRRRHWSSAKETKKEEAKILAVTELDLKTLLLQKKKRKDSRAERTQWVELWKNLRVDCAAGTVISTMNKQEESAEQAEI